MGEEENGEKKNPCDWTSPESDLFSTPKSQMEKEGKSFRFSKKRCIFFSVGFTIIVFIVVILTLAFTVYKVRGPLMKVNSVAIQKITNSSISANVNVSVKNLNQVTYYFDKTTTSVYYNNNLIGVTYQPAGKAPARRTYKMNVTMELPLDKLNAIIGGGISVGKDGGVDIDSATIVAGHVNILSLRRHVDVGMNCTVKVSVVNLTILDQTCLQQIWM
ncbi:harpin-induced like protein 18 [Zostera marina]|uniref:Harpin-induced like protein 18 n=1 Tax=Zostera marina TaxID=29655 RepID=A0A0K9PKS8_ZOSMR|nr:harpin-induced like protein 18 [Zostera marina]